MAADPHVVVVGSCNADLIVRTARFAEPGETVAGSDLMIAAGGKGANQAVAAALLGTRTSMVALVGDDAFAEVCLRSLSDSGVRTDSVSRVPGATGTAVITVDEAGENIIVVSPGANGLLEPTVVDRSRAVVESASVLALCLESPVPAVARAAEIARSAGATVVLSLSPFVIEAVHALIGSADIVLLNQHECALLVGSVLPEPARPESWGAVADALRARGIERAVITLGADGAVVVGGGAATHVPAPRVNPVDTTGAGDAFAGALAARLAEGRSLEDAAGYAVAVGACATLAAGAQPSYPTRERMQAFLAEHRPL